MPPKASHRNASAPASSSAVAHGGAAKSCLKKQSKSVRLPRPEQAVKKKVPVVHEDPNDARNKLGTKTKMGSPTCAAGITTRKRTVRLVAGSKQSKAGTGAASKQRGTVCAREKSEGTAVGDAGTTENPLIGTNALVHAEDLSQPKRIHLVRLQLHLESAAKVGRTPLVLDPSGRVATYMMYQHTNFVECKQLVVEMATKQQTLSEARELLRQNYIAAMKYGKLLVLHFGNSAPDFLGTLVDSTTFPTEVFDATQCQKDHVVSQCCRPGDTSETAGIFMVRQGFHVVILSSLDTAECTAHLTGAIPLDKMRIFVVEPEESMDGVGDGVVRGTVRVRYNHYNKEFSIYDTVVLWSCIDKEYCLSFVFHDQFTKRLRRDDTGEVMEWNGLGWSGLCDGVTYTIECEEDVNYKDITQGQGIRRGGAGGHSTTDPLSLALARGRCVGGTATDIDTVLTGMSIGDGESCSCIEGNPCVSRYNCLDWNNREMVAKKARERKSTV